MDNSNDIYLKLGKYFAEKVRASHGVYLGGLWVIWNVGGWHLWGANINDWRDDTEKWRLLFILFL